MNPLSTSTPVGAGLDASELDVADPLAGLCHEFEIPDGTYLIGNSLGALPRSARDHVATEFDRWAIRAGF